VFKTKEKRASLLPLIVGAMLAVSLAGAAHSAQIYFDTDTFLKTSTAQASALPASSKCAFTKGLSFEINSVVDAGSSHWQVTLPRAYAGCALTTGYIYQPHVSTESSVLGVTTSTLFKLSTADSTTLSASNKCALSGGEYGSTVPVSTTAGHYKLTLKTPLAGCGFTTGYVYAGHGTVGILQVSLSENTFLTKTKANPSALPAADKCALNVGNYGLRAQAAFDLPYYNVSLLGNPPACSFSTGYIAAKSTYLKAPSFNPADYTAPLASGIAGPGDQSWCACRNVGTSPHIGQDWNAAAAETSVALVNGTIVDKTFSSTCGHTLTVRDAGGADWIYRHLNQNSVQIGQNVNKGQTLGNHSTYPTSSCGTGPHLHFERRSAGAFADAEVVKTCQFGPSSCNWNPNSPFEASALKTSRVVANMTSTAEASTTTNCRSKPESYGKVTAATIEQFPLTRQANALSVAGEVLTRGKDKVLNIAAALGNNVDNACSASRRCLTSWSVVAETSSGEWVRVFHDGSIKNRPVAALAEEAHCLPSNSTGKTYILVTDQTGAKYRQDLKL
jgi:murein DD-endopeptidase MepM/ murein hydrolase activator NlpD